MAKLALLFYVTLFQSAHGFQVGTAAPMVRQTTALHSPVFTMVEKEKQETSTTPSFFDKMRGVVVKTDNAEPQEEVEDSKSMMQKVKDAGVAGIISYIFWEWAFWGVSVPVSLFGFQAATGHWPNFSDQEVRDRISGVWGGLQTNLMCPPPR